MKHTSLHQRLTRAELTTVVVFAATAALWYGQYRLHQYQVLNESGQYLSPWLNLPILLVGAALVSAFASFIILHRPVQRDSRDSKRKDPV